jgi:hypothetical protein
MKRIALLLPVLVALQVGVQPALAWAWPVDGPVLRPFILGDDPYAGGQHRGIDIAAAAGAPVRAPASGAVSFAGTVPGGGKAVTIRTADGYAVTLLHLGPYGVSRGQLVSEGDTVASVAPSVPAGQTGPFVYLGVRRADDPNGYVDPLGLLPPPVAPADPPPPVSDPDPAPAPVSTAQPGSKTTPVPPRHAHAVAHEDVDVLVAPSADAAAKERRRSGRAGGRHTADGSGELRRARAVGVPDGHPPAPEAGFIPAEASRAAMSSDRETRDGGAPVRWLIAAFCAAWLALAVVLARRRRELVHAALADRATAVFLQAASPPAEDADGLRLREQNRVVLDRNFERILLGEREALADLDRDDDPAQIVDVSDDSRSRRSSDRAPRVVVLGCSVRPHRLVPPRSLGTLRCVYPRRSLSNPRTQEGRRIASFV